jgi:sugar phosphate permease
MTTGLADEPLPEVEPAGTVRFQVLGAFALLAGLTYFDRICMAMAIAPIRREMGLNDFEVGVVFSAFTLGYAIFEVPAGRLGDAIGPRKVLARVVLWWSMFTALTGWVGGFVALLVVRFAFGAGEAGAFPNMARALTRWYPPRQRGRAQGVLWMTSRVGGALAPPLTAWLMWRVSWRFTFLVYGLFGLAWTAPFWSWYRDEPDEHPSVSAAERKWLRSWRPAKPEPEHKDAPWRLIFRNLSIWGLAGATFWSAFGWYFYITRLPEYLEKVRGFSTESSAWLSGVPLALGIFGCYFGGWVSDRLVILLGSTRWARRSVGAFGMALASVLFLLAISATNPTHTILLMGLASFCNDLPQSLVWAASMDLGERHAGSVSGIVSTTSALGALFSPILFGTMIHHGWGWTPALVSAGAAFLLSTVCWLVVDPSRPLEEVR